MLRRALPRSRERQLLPLPPFDRLPDDVQATLWQIDEAVAQLGRRFTALGRTGLERRLPVPHAAIENIHHELTPLFPPITEALDFDRSRHELALLQSHHDALTEMLAGDRPLSSVLVALAQDAAGIAALRDRPVGTRPDRCARFVIYPPAMAVPEALQALEGLIASGNQEPDSYAAMVSLVAVTNCHPFTDGNGRISRILANRLFNRNETAATWYLPLRELAAFSRGGYIIRVRQAELHGDWLPLARFLLAAIALLARHALVDIGENDTHPRASWREQGSTIDLGRQQRCHRDARGGPLPDAAC